MKLPRSKRFFALLVVGAALGLSVFASGVSADAMYNTAQTPNVRINMSDQDGLTYSVHASFAGHWINCPPRVCGHWVFSPHGVLSFRLAAGEHFVAGRGVRTYTFPDYPSLVSQRMDWSGHALGEHPEINGKPAELADANAYLHVTG